MTRQNVMLTLAFLALIAIVVVIVVFKVDGSRGFGCAETAAARGFEVETPRGNTAVGGALLTLIGTLAGCIKEAFSYEFGSSRGSADKTDILARRERRVPSSPVPGKPSPP